MKNKVTDLFNNNKFNISDAVTAINKVYREENAKAIGTVILVEKDGELLANVINAYSDEPNGKNKAFALLGAIEYLKDQVKDDE